MDHELFIFVTATGFCKKKLMLECHLEHGTELSP